ncbi:putative gpi-anchored cell wall organization protein ecm33 protein [Neofusicoccum parvum UCRNP2]|uniref:Putative gpi-anchored cell wall organization protein ecm33 protein n=1 Tax=Botryosphaeria parva (strain UCR-NP2) TaxID=1287680 RepID=R1EXJ0_BOTPV|nr:putative gpi-anchored cell wall organization protein ecm33 protein [Neofusicoccum parvum UCRNP2]
MQDVSVGITHVNNALTLSANGDELKVSFPILEWAQNITLRNVSTISMPSLSSLNGSLGLYGNKVESLDFANLKTVDGSLSIVGSDNLANISIDSLSKVGGGFQIVDNPRISDLSFPALDVSLDSIADVRGAFNLQSTENICETCAHFRNLTGAGAAIKGKFQCAGRQASPAGADATPTGSGVCASSSANATVTASASATAEASSSSTAGASASADGTGASATETAEASNGAGSGVAVGFGGVLGAGLLLAFGVPL